MNSSIFCQYKIIFSKQIATAVNISAFHRLCKKLEFIVPNAARNDVRFLRCIQNTAELRPCSVSISFKCICVCIITNITICWIYRTFRTSTCGHLNCISRTYIQNGARNGCSQTGIATNSKVTIVNNTNLHGMYRL